MEKEKSDGPFSVFGLLVGTAIITKCVRHNGEYHWYLAEAKRLTRPRKPTRMPQPVWFKPF